MWFFAIKYTWLVVAWMTPMGRVTMKARPKAKIIPHQGSCTSFFHMKDINKERAMLPISKMRNHHSGTCLYFFISFACISSFAEPIADLLCLHISLPKLRKIQIVPYISQWKSNNILCIKTEKICKRTWQVNKRIQSFHLHSMKEKNMSQGCCKPCESRPDGKCKERAEVQLPVAVICSHIQIIVCCQYRGGVIFLPRSSK